MTSSGLRPFISRRSDIKATGGHAREARIRRARSSSTGVVNMAAPHLKGQLALITGATGGM